jgi:glycosyltransferase involved in cell wall biosynthesis
MRIGLVSQEYPPETAKGGIGSQTYIKAHGLAALGHDVHVISRTPSREKTVRHDGAVKVSRIPGLDSRMGIYTSIADWLTYSGEIACAVAEIHASTPLDLIDFPEWGGEGYVHLLNRTEWNDLPTVIHLHGPLVMFGHTMDWPEMDSDFFRIGTAMEGTCVRLADAVFSSSKCSADWCSTQYNIKRENIPVIHTGVDTKLFAPRKTGSSKRPTIVFVGKLARNKGAVLLTKAACALAREFPDLQLRLIGKGDSNVLDEIKATAAQSDCSELLDVVGFVHRTDLPEHLSRAHIFAAPSKYEGGPGFVYLEAMACGLPVIACAGSGAAEVVRHGETGFLVPPEGLEDLIGYLRRLLQHPLERQTMGEAARRYVEKEAESHTCIKRLESFYQGVIDGRRERRPSGTPITTP